jgi:hypothetical protein
VDLACAIKSLDANWNLFMPKVKKGLTRLHSLDADEVSFVPEGANRRRFIIFKSAGGKSMPKPHEELEKLISKAHPEVMAKVDEMLKAHHEKMAGVHKDGEEQDYHEVHPHAHAAVKAISRIAAPFAGKVHPELMHGALDAAGHKLEHKEAALEGENEEEEYDEEEHEGQSGAMHVGDGHKLGGFMAIPEEIEGVQKEHMHEAVAHANKAYHEHLEKLGYEKYPAAEMAMKSKDGKPVMKAKGESVSKSANGAPDLSTVDAKTRQKLEAVLKSNDNTVKELVQKNADLEARIKAGEQKEREKEIVAKASTFKHIALPQEEIVATMKDADKLGKESYDRVCKQFETLNTQGEKSRLFSEYGSNLSGNTGGDAWEKIEKAAEGYVAKSGQKYSKADGINAFLETADGQKMYADYKAGRKDGI